VENDQQERSLCAGQQQRLNLDLKLPVLGLAWRAGRRPLPTLAIIPRSLVNGSFAACPLVAAANLKRPYEVSEKPTSERLL
jgi:hypothetical protein